MESIDDFQQQAADTLKRSDKSFEARLALVFGAAAEVGSIHNIYKKFLRDKTPFDKSLPALKEELGDLMWYVAMIANVEGFRLSEILAENQRRTRNRYGDDLMGAEGYVCTDFEKGFDDTRKFPRKMLLQFEEADENGVPKVRIKLLGAEPNAFPNGAVKGDDGRLRGYTLGEAIGNAVDDNSELRDGYRYHDAVHLAFVTYLNWSPVFRALMRIKRKDEEGAIDRNQDGARAIALEEAISAALAAISHDREGFQKLENVDGDVINTIRPLMRDLEVGKQPEWLWRQAIFRGFNVMHALMKNRGGYVSIDCDKREITYSLLRPQ